MVLKMRIIKKGRELPETEITCKRCDTLFAYNEKDVETLYYDQCIKTRVFCPNCGISITIQERSIG